MVPSANSNTVALVIPSEGKPSKKMLIVRPIPNAVNNKGIAIEAVLVRLLFKAPKTESPAIVIKNIPKALTSFKALELPAISIPSLALIVIGLKAVSVPITDNNNPDTNK